MIEVPTVFILFFCMLCVLPIVYTLEIFTVAFLIYLLPNRHHYKSYKIFFIQKAYLIVLICVFLILATTMKNTCTPEYPLFGAVYFLFIFYSILLLLFCYFNDAAILETDSFVNASIWLLFALCTFLFVKHYATFILNVELIAICYFFFFLQFSKSSQKTLLRLKNLFLNYLFASLFTLVFLTLSVILLGKVNGTIEFNELQYVGHATATYPWVFLLIAIFWKLGTPLFYFFKLEVYKLLPTSNLVFFSISSFLINSFIFIFLYATCDMLYTQINFILLIIILIINILTLLRGLQINTLAFFIGLSAVNTWSVLLVFFLVNGTCF